MEAAEIKAADMEIIEKEINHKETSQGDAAVIVKSQGEDCLWNAGLYDRQHTYIWRYGADLLEVLVPREGERVLDLGCGTGHLTARIAGSGARVVGIDSSESMINQARENYPQIPFEVADARNFHFPEPFDAVFSNAVLHWIKNPDAVIQSVLHALQPGGRFVAELGGRGNILALREGIAVGLEAAGFPVGPDFHPWYFPGIPEYGGLLEKQGFTLRQAALFDRPTPLDGGEDGLRSWMEMFAGNILESVPKEKHSTVLEAMEDYLRPKLYRDGTWYADYVRLRVVAVKVPPHQS